MVAFGGILLLFSLRRNRRSAPTRRRGMVALSALLVETLILFVGIASFVLGVVSLMPRL